MRRGYALGMSSPSAASPAPPWPPPAPGVIRLRRVISMILSCAAIVGAGTVLGIHILGAPSPFSEMIGSGALVRFAWASTQAWRFPAFASLILLSALPRPTEFRARVPTVFAAIACVASVTCVLAPPLYLTLSFGIQVLLWIW